MKLQITIEGKKYDVEVEVAEEASAVPLAAAPRAVSSGGPAPRAASGGDARPVAGEKAVRSPLAGSVTEILVKVGDAVSPEQPVLTLEAMKMLTTVTSPIEGKVTSIEIAAGDAVKPNQLLVSFE